MNIAKQKIEPTIDVEGPLSKEEQWRHLYQSRLFEVRTLHKALTKRAKRIAGMKKKIARLEKQVGR